MGGETADVGDGAYHSRKRNNDSTLAKNRLITNENIKPGNVIVGLSSLERQIMKRGYSNWYCQ